MLSKFSGLKLTSTLGFILYKLNNEQDIGPLYPTVNNKICVIRFGKCKDKVVSRVDFKPDRNQQLTHPLGVEIT